ncbi:magnesium transporter [Actinomycetota bacterium]
MTTNTQGDESLIIVMRKDADAAAVDHVVERLHDIGAEAHISEGRFRTVIGALGDRQVIQQLPWEAFPGVERAVPVLKPFKFVSRDFQQEDSVVEVGGTLIGGGHFAPIAGPCAVESREQLFSSAEAVVKAGARVLRGDAFKPRTSPYSFQGLEEKGLELLAEAREEFSIPFVAEAVDPRDVELVSGYADIIRVGTRNMANFTLLSELGKQSRPVLLKRGLTATIEEWLNAAEYIYKEGNSGAQSLAVIIRAMALGDLPPGRAMRAVRREFLVGITNAASLAVLAALAAWTFAGDQKIGIVMGLAVGVNLAVAGFAGAGIPVLLRRLGLDPALASNIFLTLITDLVGFGGFLLTASILL